MNQPANSHLLGNNPDPFSLFRFSEYTDHVAAMASQCQRKILIFSQDFDQQILDNDQVETAIRSFLTSNSRVARLKILVQRPENAIAQGHRLIELARKLTSLIEIRQPAQQHRGIAEAFSCFDRSGFIYRELGDRPDGSGCYHDPLKSLELARKFDEIWALSEPLSEFRQLSI